MYPPESSHGWSKLTWTWVATIWTSSARRLRSYLLLCIVQNLWRMVLSNMGSKNLSPHSHYWNYLFIARGTFLAASKLVQSAGKTSTILVDCCTADYRSFWTTSSTTLVDGCTSTCRSFLTTSSTTLVNSCTSDCRSSWRDTSTIVGDGWKSDCHSSWRDSTSECLSVG